MNFQGFISYPSIDYSERNLGHPKSVFESAIIAV
jgi:hypothetical protein